MKYAGTAELRDAMKIDVATVGDSLHVRTVRPSERRGNMGAKYVIKVPRKIVFLPEIPKGATGKLQRISLAEKLGLTA